MPPVDWYRSLTPVGLRASRASASLVLLDERAEPAAARKSDVGEAGTLEVVLGADVGALHRHGHPVEPEAARSTEEEALHHALG